MWSIALTFTFSPKGSTLWLPFGISELPASLLLCPGAISKSDNKHGYEVTMCSVDTLDREVIPVPGGTQLAGTKSLCHSGQGTIQNIGIVYFWNFPFNISGLWLTNHE